MRFIFFYIAFIFFANPVIQAQPYNNEWINFSRDYFKIKVVRDGLYRIPAAVLQATGLPSEGAGYKLLHNGQEVPLYTTTNTAFGTNDYIEFYGQKNDGSADLPLYTNPEWQPSPHKNLFSDTTTYFLTWDNSAENRRYYSIANDLLNPPPATPYFMHRSTLSPAASFAGGEPRFDVSGIKVNAADFEAGEGWGSLSVLMGNTSNFNINTAAPYTGIDAPTPLCRVKLLGRGNDPLVQPDHPVRISFNNIAYKDTLFEGYGYATVHFSPLLSDFGTPQSPLGISALSGTSSTNTVSLAYATLEYPRLFDFGNQRIFDFTLQDNGEKYLEISNFNGESAPVLFDVSNGWRFLPVFENGIYKVRLPQGNNPVSLRRLIMLNSTSAQSLNIVQNLISAPFTNFLESAKQGSFVLLSSELLASSAQAYTDYRTSFEGGMHTVANISVEQLYDQFAFGIAKHPLAIRNFVNYALDHWTTAPHYLLLLGKGIVYSDFSSATAYSQCLVPTYGHQASDQLLAARNAESYVPQLAVGRVPARNNADVLTYIDKLRQYEAHETDFECMPELFAWRSNTFGLASAANANLLAFSNQSVETYQSVLSGAGFGAQSLGNLSQQGSPPISLTPFAEALQAGLGMVFFAGKSNNNNYWDLQIQNPDAYNNNGKYPFILSQSDYTGNIHSPSSTMSLDYVLAPQRGAIGFLDNVGLSAPASSRLLNELFLARLNGSDFENGVGQALKNSIADINASDTLQGNLHILACQSNTLAGDPALSVVPGRKAEFRVTDADLVFHNPLTGFPLFGDPVLIPSSVQNFEARLHIENLGRWINDSISILVQRLTPQGIFLDIETKRVLLNSDSLNLSFWLSNELDAAGANTFIFRIDADDDAPEYCDINNIVSKACIVQVFNSVEMPQLLTNVHIYPNPVVETLQIDAALPNAQFELKDTQGRTLKQGKLNEQIITEVEMKEFPAGLYVLQISNSSGYACLKVVKR